MDLPQYRKHASGKSYYIILDEDEYTEFQLVGNQIFRYDFKIKTYFDKVHMKSLLEASFPFSNAEKHEIDTLLKMR